MAKAIIEFNCSNCGKSIVEEMDYNCLFVFTSCGCGKYYNIINQGKYAEIEEITKEEYDDFLNVMIARRDANE